MNTNGLDFPPGINSEERHRRVSQKERLNQKITITGY